MQASAFEGALIKAAVEMRYRRSCNCAVKLASVS
jgi:hypothetical protein